MLSPRLLRGAAGAMVPLLALVLVIEYAGRGAHPEGIRDAGTSVSADLPAVSEDPVPFVLVVEPLAPRLPAVPPSAPLPREGLVIPVAGVTTADLVNSFAEPRGDARRHLAIDILAPTGTPVLAAADGRVVRMRHSARGGLTIYATGPTGDYVYYYAHLDAYAEGLEEGALIRQGEVIGYVGHTGNAHEDVPHLHFAIWLRRPGSSGFGGRPVNPYLALTR
jgi:peptidoglycan LD-endopeptidase LytH